MLLSLMIDPFLMIEFVMAHHRIPLPVMTTEPTCC
jgi:hypothetical protein